MKRYLPIVAVAALVSLFTSGAVQTLFSALADQSERVPPTSGIYTGPQWSQKVGDAVRSISTGNKGSVAPANVGGSTVDGLEWIDDSGTPWIKKRYVNGGWAVEGALDPADSSYVGVIGGGSATIASASTVNLGSVPQANVTITGTTTITGFGSAAPPFISKIIRFAGSLTLTYSSALTVPGGFDLTTTANDRAIVTHLGSGNWEVTQYTRANGIPVDVSAVGEIKFGMWATPPALHAPAYGQAMTRASYPVYVAKVTRSQNGTRTSGNATITAVANTTGLGVGMPVEGTGVNAGCTIASVVANTSVTLNSSSCVTSSGTSTVTVFLTGYGTGGNSTNIGAPDCRGRALAGIPELSGVLTSTYYGTNPNAFNAPGGAQSKTLLTTNLPPYTPAGTVAVTNGAITIGGQGGLIQGNGSGLYPGGSFGSNAGSPLTASQAASSAAFTGTAQGGASTAFSGMQPTLIAECVVRVTP